MTEMTPNLDRFQGCLVGLALGDALGAPYEFRKAPVPDVSATFKRGVFGTAPGAPTDDSTLAMICAQDLLAHDGVLYDDWYMEHLKEWLASRPPDVGAQTSKAILNWPKRLAPDENACSNGSLMACAPIGLANAGHTSLAVDVGVMFSNLTHPSSRSARAVSFLCQSIARLVVDPRPVPPLEAQIRVPDGWKADGPQVGYVLGCAGLAYKFAGEAQAADECTTFLLGLIRQGGDTDTNAAVCGALMGARFGMAAWPEAMVSELAIGQDMLDAATGLHRVAVAHI